MMVVKTHKTTYKTTQPGYKPTNEERETIITYNQTGEPATVFTYNPALIRKLDALSEQRPREVIVCRAESINGVQCREYELPKKWIKVNPSLKLSDEQRAKRAEQMDRNLKRTI